MATLELTNGKRVAVWRYVKWLFAGDETTAGDPVYADAGIELVFADDADRETTRSLDSYGENVVRFTPTNGTGAIPWAHEAALRPPLVIQVEVSLTQPDLEDLLNLQEAFESTLNPASGDVQKGLVAAGALSGETQFTGPLRVVQSTTPRNDGRVVAVGSFTIEIERPLL